MILLFLAPCGMAQNRRRVSKAEYKMFHDYSIRLEDSLKNSRLVIPTQAAWEKDRNEFIKMIDGYIDKHERYVRREAVPYISRPRHSFPLFPLIESSGNNGAVIVALAVVLVSGIVVAVEHRNRPDREINNPDNTYNLLLDFESYWGSARSPATREELKNYLKAKQQLMDNMTLLKDAGSIE